MAKRKKPTAARVRAVFRYERSTGALYYRHDIKSGRGKIECAAGSRAGTVSTKNGQPYRQVRVDGVLYLEHILIWVIVTGAWPKALVDHRDNDGLNNRWGNLRQATYPQNLANARLNSRNRAGLKGVRSKPNGKFQATITATLGTFKTKHAAHAAYCKAAKVLHGAFFNDGTRKEQSLGR